MLSLRYFLDELYDGFNLPSKRCNKLDFERNKIFIFRFVIGVCHLALNSVTPSVSANQV